MKFVGGEVRDCSLTFFSDLDPPGLENRRGFGVLDFFDVETIECFVVSTLR